MVGWASLGGDTLVEDVEHVEGFVGYRKEVVLGLPKKLKIAILIIEILKIPGMDIMRHKIFDMRFSSVYLHYLA